MKFASLQIDRFGARSNLQLDQLSDGLNVIYGPNGSGKTTIISFIRWILYGSRDEVVRRYLSAGDVRVGGALRIVDGQHRRRMVARHHDTLHGDQVRVTQDDQPAYMPYSSDRLTGVELNEYRLVFSFGFDQTPSIEQLVQSSATRDFALTYDESQVRRMRELTDRLETLRRTYGLPNTDESVASLHDRRRELLAEIDQVERQRHERLRRIQTECDELAAEIAEDRRQLGELNAALQRTDSNLEVRRRQLEQAAYEAHQVRARWHDERRQEAAELDFQLQQWHQVLEAIRERHKRLQDTMVGRSLESTVPSVSDEADLKVFLRSLGYQIDDIETDLRDWEDVEGRRDPALYREYVRSVFGAALHSMRDDVQRLCRELQRQQSNSKHLEQAREQDHLRRCEAELTSLMDSLHQRRDSLHGSLDFADPAWLASQVNGREYSLPSLHRTGYESHSLDELWSNGTYAARQTTDPVHPASGFDPSYTRITDPVLEARIAHLSRRREHLAARVREVEVEMSRAEQRLESLQSSQHAIEEVRTLERLRRDLEGIESRLRLADERARRREEMVSLERQIDELRRTLGPSEILRDAGHLLVQMTDGAYRGIRVNDRREVFVEDDRGHTLFHSDLSRGTRDQVYLSIALALASAYRRRGIELPLVLNDVFVNIDSDRTQPTAEVIAQYASRGHQVILFTRHEHILQRFSNLQAKLFTLRERVRPYDLPRTERSEPSRPVEPIGRSETYYLDQAPIVPVRGVWDPPTRPLPSDPPAEPRRDRRYEWSTPWEGAARHVPSRSEPLETKPGGYAEASPLSDVEWLHRDCVMRLRDLGIQTVIQFLELDPEEGERHLHRYAVPAATLFRWQSELALQVYVGLSASDAALLVACGVDDPEELSYIDASELHRRIEQYLSTSDLRNRYGSIARFERSRLSRWIQAARRSHYRRHRQRWSRYGNGRSVPPKSANGTSVPAVERVTPRARRVDPPRPARTVETPQPSAPKDVANDESKETLRFYLELSDPIVDAPSIGPKTAERFHAIGVTSIQELLELDPADAAERINYRRITQELIRDWQLQTTLVCRVPNLRGHDAQILVACDVPGADQLAKLSPETLHAQVSRFVATNEGKRILRSAKAPDVDEVRAWVRWAQHARELAVA